LLKLQKHVEDKRTGQPLKIQTMDN